MSNKTILITGIAGFIGSRLAKWLLDNTEHEVIGIDNLLGGFKENIPPGVVWYNRDISKDRIDDIFEKHQPDIVYGIHAYASEGRANHIRGFIHLNNTLSMAYLVNACVNYNSKLVFTSSVAVYSGNPPFTERTEPCPIDEYGLSKWMTERSIRIAGEEQGLNWVIVRPRNVYGIGQNLFDPSRNLFGILCYNALNNLPLTIFGTGENKRSFTYVDDILAPLYKASDFNNEVFNLGSEYTYTINQAIQIFSQVSGYSNIIHTEERPEVKEAFCRINKSYRMLEFSDATSLEEGVKRMWEWAKKQPMRPRQVPPPLEISKNIHSSLR